MNKKKLFIFSTIISLFLFSGMGYYLTKKNNITSDNSNIHKEIIKDSDSNAVETKIAPTEQKTVNNRTNIKKKADLYNDNSALPLSAVAEISALPEHIKKTVNKIINNNTLYYIKQKNDVLFMIIEHSNSEDNPRHDIDLVQIYENGTQKEIPLGYSESEDETDHDDWTYDKISGMPIKHINYDSKGNIHYTETWNFSDDEPIKYELKNNENKTISLQKEILDSNENLRVEHLLYDDQGNTKISISKNFEGANLTRFTYYNADDIDDSITIVTEYNDGIKSKEQLYTSDYKLKNTYHSDYENGERVNIKVFDNQNNKIEELCK